ncbi:MAG: GGDEF and EAL domain-containing protein [Lachnospiraceae bacterium]|nr:GGDEF and EAL domain-containing protein [Lachnospiraceae bacterium]
MTEISIPENAKKRLDSLFEAFHVVAEGTYVYLCDMKYDYSRWSQNAVEYFGLPSEYMKDAGVIWEQHIHPEDRAAYWKSIEDIFSGQDDGHDMQYRACKPDGQYVVCTCRGVVIRDENGNPAYFAGAIRNHGIQGNIDPLTGLRNQYGFFEDLKERIARNRPAVVVMVGIGGFTEINEVFGYEFGNLVLQRFARYLLNDIGNKGNVYRMDGTKFAVICRNMDVDKVRWHYNEARSYYGSGIEVDGRTLTLMINAGAMRLDSFDVDSQTVYSCLNFAYGESKALRQGEMVIFFNKLSDENRQRLEKLQVIRNSIPKGCADFFLLYQPVVDARTERVKGAEALIRWKNETYGMVPPDLFIPILERDRLFPELGRWILRTAILEGKKFVEENPDFVLNVNLSYAQLEKRDFIDMVKEVLAETGYPPENLCLEVTERCRLLDVELLKNTIMVLHALGIRFALDDFGTGFSAVGLVKMLPFDTIKIDRSFVMKIEEDEMERALIGHFTGLAGTFGAQVCVEGVETAGMMEILKGYGVSSFQGYYYSRPVSASECLAFMRSRAEGPGD